MAGTSIGAAALLTPSSRHARPGNSTRIGDTTRTRRNHGVFMLGNELACVYSSRRAGNELQVLLSVGTGAVVLTGAMTATQARAMAKALIAAAASLTSGRAA